MGELIKNAFSGLNLIPTILLILVLLYWITVIIGLLDLDFLDLDFDPDLDLDAGDGISGFQEVLTFFNMKDIPVMVVFSILVLFFWIFSMLIYLIPVPKGGLVHNLLLLPALILSIILTKLITTPLKGVFKTDEAQSQETAVIGQIVTVVSDVREGHLGQAELNRDGMSMRINVKAEFSECNFRKNEEALVTKKDEKDIYYIVKLYEQNQ